MGSDNGAGGGVMDYPFVRVVPVAIREGLTISFGPVPLDLTRAEAEKLARVILAYAQPEQP